MTDTNIHGTSNSKFYGDNYPFQPPIPNCSLKSATNAISSVILLTPILERSLGNVLASSRCANNKEHVKVVLALDTIRPGCDTKK